MTERPQPPLPRPASIDHDWAERIARARNAQQNGGKLQVPAQGRPVNLVPLDV